MHAAPPTTPALLHRAILVGSLPDAVTSAACSAAGFTLLATTADAATARLLAGALRPDVVLIHPKSLEFDVRPLARELAGATAVAFVGAELQDTLNAFAARVATVRADGEAPRAADRLTLRDGARLLIVQPNTIEWLEAAGNYVRLHAEGGHRLVRSTLASLEARLDPAKFVRMHRSAIVNLDRVAMVEPAGRDQVLVLRSGRRLPVSRSFRARLAEALRYEV